MWQAYTNWISQIDIVTIMYPVKHHSRFEFEPRGSVQGVI